MLEQRSEESRMQGKIGCPLTVGFSSVAVMTNFWGRDLSHFGQQVQTEEVTDGKASIHDVFEKKVMDGMVSIHDLLWQGSGFCMS